MSDPQDQVAANDQADHDTSMAPASPLSPTTNMNTDEPRQEQDEGRRTGQRQPAKPHARPRLDLSTGAGAAKERKRGKSMFGLVLGTLNKAKIEDKERNASEAAKKRQLIDQRLQNKLKKETDSVRRAEEVKKDKSSANRKEEELQLKHSIFKYRRTHIPQVARFLCTADEIPSEMDDDNAQASPLKLPSRSHPPPVYYMPAILLPAQEAFLARRAPAVAEAAEKEWEEWREECKTGVESIKEMRVRAKEEEDKRKAEREAQAQEEDSSTQPHQDDDAKMKTEDADTEMAVDEEGPAVNKEEEKKDVKSEEDSSSRPAANGVANGAAKDDSMAMQADEEDAVEY